MLEIKNVKKIQIRRSRFGYESESEYYSSCKNHESESEYSGFGGKDSNPNPNPNIRYNTGRDIVVHHFGELSGNTYLLMRFTIKRFTNFNIGPSQGSPRFWCFITRAS